MMKNARNIPSDNGMPISKRDLLIFGAAGVGIGLGISGLIVKGTDNEHDKVLSLLGLSSDVSVDRAVSKMNQRTTSSFEDVRNRAHVIQMAHAAKGKLVSLKRVLHNSTGDYDAFVSDTTNVLQRASFELQESSFSRVPKEKKEMIEEAQANPIRWVQLLRICQDSLSIKDKDISYSQDIERGILQSAVLRAYNRWDRIPCTKNDSPSPDVTCMAENLAGLLVDSRDESIESDLEESLHELNIALDVDSKKKFIDIVKIQVKISREHLARNNSKL